MFIGGRQRKCNVNGLIGLVVAVKAATSFAELIKYLCRRHFLTKFYKRSSILDVFIKSVILVEGRKNHCCKNLRFFSTYPQRILSTIIGKVRTKHHSAQQHRDVRHKFLTPQVKLLGKLKRGEK